MGIYFLLCYGDFHAVKCCRCLVQATPVLLVVRAVMFGGQGCPTTPQVGDLDCFCQARGPIVDIQRQSTRTAILFTPDITHATGGDSPPFNCIGDFAETNNTQAEFFCTVQHGEPRRKHTDRHGDFASVHGHIWECHQGKATGMS